MAYKEGTQKVLNLSNNPMRLKPSRKEQTLEGVKHDGLYINDE